MRTPARAAAELRAAGFAALIDEQHAARIGARFVDGDASAH